MSMEAASIAQHCRSLRLSAIGSLPLWPRKPGNRTILISIAWKPCCKPRSKSAKGAPSSCESRTHTCGG